MKFKDIKLQIKEVTEKGEFSGYASTFGNEDLGGDIIMPGAFAKTISEKQDLPILWGHNPREVIGVNRSMKEDAKGLQVTGQLVMDVQRAKEAHSLMREGAVKGLSIGFDSIVVDFSRYEKEGIRILKEIKLWEYSLTPFPMNPEATVTAVKTFEDLEQSLRSILAYKSDGPLAPMQEALIEQAIKGLSALRAAQSAPGAAKQDELAPEILHAMSSRTDSIAKILQGEL